MHDWIITVWPIKNYLHNGIGDVESNYDRNIQFLSFDDLSHENLDFFFSQFVIWSSNSLKQISSCHNKILIKHENFAQIIQLRFTLYTQQQ